MKRAASRASVEEAAYWVGAEAITNVFRHPSAPLLDVSWEYGDDLFRLRVSDNGAGIEPRVLRAGGRPGHMGLSLMKERTAVAGGTLTIWSHLGAGTTVELVMPGNIGFVVFRDGGLAQV